MCSLLADWPRALGATSLLPLIAAPFIGSFLGVVASRFHAPRTILWARSACPRCDERLGIRDLVPLASWLGLRGRCRHCGEPIGAFYPAIELAALGLAAWSVMLASGWLVWVSCLLGWTLLALAVIDARHYLLPDFLTLPLVPTGLLVNAALDPAAVLPAAIGAAAGFLVILAVRHAYWRLRGREGIGLGDAKLLAAAGAWVGWQGLASVVLIGALLGLALALLRSVRRGSISLVDRVPFGSLLCAGLWIVWLYGPLG